MNQSGLVTTDRRENVVLVYLITALLVFATIMVTAAAQKSDKSVSKQQKTLALAENEVKQLLLLMDADKNGKISKKEFMGFMSAEFDRLDTDNSGELDTKELMQSQLRPGQPAVGK